MGDVTHARHGPQVTAGVASLAAGHSGIRPQQRLPVGRLGNTRQSCTVWRYIALVRRAKPLWALERFEQANVDVETILSTTGIAVEQKTAARLMRAG